jgi:hypothetical protein
MGDQTFDDYLKTRAICLTVGDVGKLEEEVIRYMRESWGEAVRQEREAIAATFDNITQIRRLGVEIAAAIRARSEQPPS